MLQVAASAIMIAAFAAWVMAVLAVLQMLKHREPGVSGWWFATNGMAFFTGRNFLPEAAPARRQFLRYAGLFALAVVVGMIVGGVAASTKG